jgi:hypothetical protein
MKTLWRASGKLAVEVIAEAPSFVLFGRDSAARLSSGLRG